MYKIMDMATGEFVTYQINFTTTKGYKSYHMPKSFTSGPPWLLSDKGCREARFFTWLGAWFELRMLVRNWNGAVNILNAFHPVSYNRFLIIRC